MQPHLPQNREVSCHVQVAGRRVRRTACAAIVDGTLRQGCSWWGGGGEVGGRRRWWWCAVLVVCVCVCVCVWEGNELDTLFRRERERGVFGFENVVVMHVDKSEDEIGGYTPRGGGGLQKKKLGLKYKPSREQCTPQPYSPMQSILWFTSEKIRRGLKEKVVKGGEGGNLLVRFFFLFLVNNGNTPKAGSGGGNATKIPTFFVIGKRKIRRGEGGKSKK